MPNWTDEPSLSVGDIVKTLTGGTPANWTDHVANNLTALNDIIGHPNGGHRSLTDGGVLLGNGTGAIQAMSVLAKGSLLVGDGVTDPQELVAGANNLYLTADSAQSVGLKYATPSDLSSNPEDIMLYA